MTSGKWWSFYGTREDQDGAVLFDVRCACCGEFVTRHDLDELPSKCPRCGEGATTNYEKLFGTPERAARTLTHVCQFTHGGELCDRCQCYLFDKCNRELRIMSEQRIYDALLEWLRGDA